MKAVQNTIAYDPEKYALYQTLNSGNILHIGGSADNVLIETHQEVWSPTPFAITMGKIIASDCCKDKCVMDFAAGSGYLAVVLGKMGASKVVATDFNPQAVKMTQRNWELNGLDREKLVAVESDRFESLKREDDKSDFEGLFDFIYSNPPSIPDLEENTDKRTGMDWNLDGKTGRITLDALLVEGRKFLKPGGEMVIGTSSKQGAALTCELLEQHWGKGVKAKQGNNPLDYTMDWRDKGDANWCVIKREDIPFPYYGEHVEKFREMARDKKQPDPFFEKDGVIHQKLYFIRAKKT